MKRTIAYFIILSTILLITVSCSDEPNLDASAKFIGVIEEIDNSTAIVTPNDNEDILLSGDKVRVNLSVSDDTFYLGDEIVVYYTGEIMESYPLQINTVNVESADE